MGGTHSEREDFAKSARRDVGPISYENALLSFGSSINLTSREKVSVHWGIKKKIIHKIFWGGSWNVWGGGGDWNIWGGSSPPPLDRTLACPPLVNCM